MSNRHVTRIIRGLRASDGAGVRLFRSLGQSEGLRLDPFLMLDEIVSDDAQDYLAGFPPHPHRGFETVTYMLDGRMRHEDHLGNNGVIGPGDVQWMTAARGIVHSEMPEQTEGRLHGFQLWINLPAAEKMKPAAYDDITASRIPEASIGNAGVVRVIAGKLATAHGVISGPVSGISTAPLFLDLRFSAAGVFRHEIPADHNAFLYVYRGQVRVGETTIERGHLGVLSDGAAVTIDADGPAGALLLAAKPLHEPVVQYGPFVMNSREEIEQAIADYRDGTLAQAPAA